MQAILKLPYAETTLQVINVHLRPPVREDGSANLFTASQTNPIRKAELEYLSKQVKFSENEKSIPTFILGDFNENDGAPGSLL